MKKSFVQNTLTGLLAVALVGVAFQTRAEDKTNAPSVTPAPKHDKIPYSGTLSAVDKTAMTITVKKKESEKTYTITSTTKFVKAEKPATLDDAKVGDEVRGQYKKTAAGKLDALSVYIGPKPEKPAKSKKPEGTNSIESK